MSSRPLTAVVGMIINDIQNPKDLYQLSKVVELQVANMGMSSVVKGEDRKMELWISGQSDIYRSALSDISYICMLENTRCQ